MSNNKDLVGVPRAATIETVAHEEAKSESVVLLPLELKDPAFVNVLTALRSKRLLNAEEATTLKTCYMEWDRAVATSPDDLKQSTSSKEPDKLSALVMTKMGWKAQLPTYMEPLPPKLTNEDRAFVMKYTQEHNNESIPVLVAGVLDGHGEEGDAVAEWSRHEFLRRLPCVLLEVETLKVASMMTAGELEVKVKAALSELIVSIDRDLPEPAATNGGATISIVLHYRNVLYFVNTGDSQSYLVAAIVASSNRFASDKAKESSSAGQLQQAVYVLDSWECWSTFLHNPLSERARLEAAGMQVSDGGRVTCNTAAYDLCMSRSIGDREMVGVIATPQVSCLRVTTLNDLMAERYNRKMLSEANKSGDSSKATSGTEASQVITADNVRLFAVSATDGFFDQVPSYKFHSLLAESLIGNKEHVALTVEGMFNEATRKALDKSEQTYCDDMAIAIAQIV
jgi:Protein phosphatase 2C